MANLVSSPSPYFRSADDDSPVGWTVTPGAHHADGVPQRCRGHGARVPASYAGPERADLANGGRAESVAAEACEG